MFPPLLEYVYIYCKGFGNGCQAKSSPIKKSHGEKAENPLQFQGEAGIIKLSEYGGKRNNLMTILFAKGAKHMTKRLLATLLLLAMFCALVPTVLAAPTPVNTVNITADLSYSLQGLKFNSIL
jgi:hypothetical protein